MSPESRALDLPSLVSMLILIARQPLDQEQEQAQNPPLPQASKSSRRVNHTPSPSVDPSYHGTPSGGSAPYFHEDEQTLEEEDPTSEGTLEEGDPTPEGTSEEDASVEQDWERDKRQAQALNVESDRPSSRESDDSQDAMSSQPITVCNDLRLRWYFKDEDRAKIKGAAIVKAAMDIIDGTRISKWSEEHKAKVLEAYADNKEELEGTFIANFFRHLLGGARRVPVGVGLTEEQLKKESAWIEETWRKSGLKVRHNIDFRTDSLPSIRSGDAKIDALIDGAPRVEKPRPDIAFGIYDTAFSDAEQHILRNEKNCLTGPRVFGIFFSIDVKCGNQGILAAENQCQRSGCAMVVARRLLNEAATVKRGKATSSSSSAKIASRSAPVASITKLPEFEYSKGDLSSFAFSLAVDNYMANLFVNWAMEMEIPDIVQWHMTTLRTYLFTRPIELAQLYHDMNNICDWGVSTHLNELKNLALRIYNLQDVDPKSSSPKKRKKGPDDESKDPE